MLPTEDAAWVAAELSRRFGPRRWQFTLSATDANRFAIRIARHLTGRPKVLVFDYCYHGTVDESFASLADGGPCPREGTSAPPVTRRRRPGSSSSTTSPALERELAGGDVACVLAEPALTNIGIVLPEPGFHDGAARADRADRHPADHRRDPHAQRRPGGCTARWASSPTWSPSARRSPAASRSAPSA